MKFSDSTSPERALFCREEKDGGRPNIYDIFQGRVTLPAAPRNISQGRLMPLAAPENGAHFQGRLMAPAAPGNHIFRGGFSGAGEKLQYPAPVVGAGYICTHR